MTSMPDTFKATGDTIAKRFPVAGGGMVCIERTKDYASMTWPTDLTPGEFFSRVAKVIKLSKRRTSIYVQDGSEFELSFAELDELGSREDILLVRSDPAESGPAIGWQRSAYSKEGVEGGYGDARLSIKVIELLLRHTGNSAVDESRERILSTARTL